MDTSERVALVRRAYALFNAREIDPLLAMMTADVEWPDVVNRAVLHGKEAIRLYWQRQFEVADSRVTLTDFIEAGDDLVAVVEQRILDLRGQPLTAPAVVFHRYTFAGDFVTRMVVFTERDEAVITS